MSQNFPPQNGVHLHSKGSSQVPCTQPSAGMHSEQKGPVQPCRHLNKVCVKTYSSCQNLYSQFGDILISENNEPFFSLL